MPTDPRTRQVVELAALLVIVGLYLFLQRATLYTTIGDQNLYFYASFLWTQGVVPYRDFFLSHPPFHILVSTLAVLLGGMNLEMLFILPSIIGALSGLLLYVITRRALGGIPALLAVSLFLFSHRNLAASAYFTGVNTSLFFLLLGVFFYQIRAVLLAGIALGVGAASGVYIVVGGAALIVVDFLENRRNALKHASSFAATFGLINVLFLLIAGRGFLDQVYLYHLEKFAESAFFPSKMAMFMHMLKPNLVLIILALCAIPTYVVEVSRRSARVNSKRGEELGLVRLSLVMLAAYACFFIFLRRIFTHYFQVCSPFAVIGAAYVITRVLGWGPTSGKAHRVYLVTSLLLVAGLVAGSIGMSVNRHVKDRDMRRFENGEKIAAYIESNVKENETIYGGFGVVPLLAALSGRRIAANEIESNIMRFESGTSSMDEVVERIEADNVAMVIFRPRRGLAIYAPFVRYLKQNYVPARRFQGRRPWTTLDVWRRRR